VVKIKGKTNKLGLEGLKSDEEAGSEIIKVNDIEEEDMISGSLKAHPSPTDRNKGSIFAAFTSKSKKKKTIERNDNTLFTEENEQKSPSHTVKNPTKDHHMLRFDILNHKDTPKFSFMSRNSL
jgi:hypothetical protein